MKFLTGCYSTASDTAMPKSTQQYRQFDPAAPCARAFAPNSTDRTATLAVMNAFGLAQG
jgi:hypothetical protein